MTPVGRGRGGSRSGIGIGVGSRGDNSVDRSGGCSIASGDVDDVGGEGVFDVGHDDLIALHGGSKGSGSQGRSDNGDGVHVD